MNSWANERSLKDYFSIQFNGPRAAENGLKYLVSATLGSYSPTDYLHFVARRKGKNVHDLKLKEKINCASRYGLQVREGSTCQFPLKRPALWTNFSVASMIVLFIRTANSE